MRKKINKDVIKYLKKRISCKITDIIILNSSLYLIIIIILLHSFLVICLNEQCSGCNNCEPTDPSTGECNEQKCRPHLYSGSCYYCEGLTPSKYYSISGESCTVKTQATECNKITYENNECVDDCGDGFELGGNNNDCS